MNMNGGDTEAKDSGAVVFSSVPPLTLSLFLLWCLRQQKRFRVTGQSMRPTLDEGQEVLVKAFKLKESPAQGQLILLRHPTNTELTMIKRCVKVEDGHAWVQGDNSSASTDSRQFGPVPLDLVLGFVSCTFP